MESALEKARHIFFAIPNTAHTHLPGFFGENDTQVPDTLIKEKPVVISLLGMCLLVEESVSCQLPQGLIKKMQVDIQQKGQAQPDDFLQDKVCNLHLKQCKTQVV